MTDSICIPCGSSHSTAHIHSSFSHENKEDKTGAAFRVVEKVCALVIGVFAAITEFWLFLPSFVFGAIIGAVTYKPLSPSSHQHPEGTCSVGFIEQTTGVKLPRSIALAAGFAVMVAHIDHHATVFVPIVGVTLGLLAGKTAARMLNRKNLV